MESSITNEEYVAYLKTKGLDYLLDRVDGECSLVRRSDGKYRLVITDERFRPVYFEDSPLTTVIDAILWQGKRGEYDPWESRYSPYVEK